MRTPWPRAARKPKPSSGARMSPERKTIPATRIGAYGMRRSSCASCASQPATSSAVLYAGVASTTASASNTPPARCTRHPPARGSIRSAAQPTRTGSASCAASAAVSRCIPLTPKPVKRPAARPARAMPRITDPCSSSKAARRGKSAVTLVAAASPPLTPSSAGATIRSATSRPKRRVANAATLSSSSAARRRPTRSPSARAFPAAEGSDIVSARGGLAGSSCRAPRQ